MPPERPLLTIAIPTYNRSACLAQLLEILAPQLTGEERVELIISDNASPDDTPNVVSTFREKGLALTYSRNETNIGADANFIRCYERARGEYVWIFGDDDIIVPGGLNEVLRLLEPRVYKLLYIRATGFQGRYSVARHPRFSRKINAFHNPQDFALRVSTGFTFISGIIFQKAAIGSQQSNFSGLIGTNLAQLGWTFSLLRDSADCAYVLDNLIACRVENSGGYGASQVFGTNLHAVVRDFLGLESPVGRAILNRTIQCWFPWAMMQSRRGRHSTHLPEDSMAILLALYSNNPRYWFFVHPILRLPRVLAEVWLRVGMAINRLDRLVGYPIAR
jgi:abequosyltransferase